MVTRIPAVQPRNRGSFPDKRKRFLFSPALVVTHLQTQWLAKALPPWIKLSGCASDHSPPSNTRMTNEWRYTFPHPIHLYAIHCDSFTVTDDIARAAASSALSFSPACTCSDARYGTVSYVRVPIFTVCIRALML